MYDGQVGEHLSQESLMKAGKLHNRVFLEIKSKFGITTKIP